MRARTAAAVCAAALMAAAGAGAGTRTGDTAAQDIGWFNAQRAANGIPTGITENADWSAKCDKHITFLQKAGGPLRHEEEPSSPFYSDEGNWGGTHSVLAQGDGWQATSNPWEWAPIHLAQLMSPQLSEMGVADRDGYVCATTWPGFERTPPPTTSIVTYPGNNSTIYASETAAESPFTPEDIVGLSGATGPNLYVYEWGPALNDYWTATKIAIQSASLSAPDEDIPVKWVDSTTDRIGLYLPTASGIVMPVRPLRAGMSYQASVQFNDGTEYRWTLKTAQLENHVAITGLGARKHRKRWSGGTLLIQSDAPHPVVRVTFRANPVKLTLHRRGHGLQATGTQVKHGMRICVSSGGGDTGYKPEHLCRAI
jgi:hypothetical protein